MVDLLNLLEELVCGMDRRIKRNKYRATYQSSEPRAMLPTEEKQVKALDEQYKGASCLEYCECLLHSTQMVVTYFVKFLS